MSGNIKVVCRFRPPNSLELRESGEQVIDLDPSEETVTVGGVRLYSSQPSLFLKNLQFCNFGPDFSAPFSQHLVPGAQRGDRWH